MLLHQTRRYSASPRRARLFPKRSKSNFLELDQLRKLCVVQSQTAGIWTTFFSRFYQVLVVMWRNFIYLSAAGPRTASSIDPAPGSCSLFPKRSKSNFLELDQLRKLCVVQSQAGGIWTAFFHPRAWSSRSQVYGTGRAIFFIITISFPSSSAEIGPLSDSTLGLRCDDVVDAEPADDHETRTTVMIRNIPNKYSQIMLIQHLFDLELKGKFDYFYLPIDFRNRWVRFC